MAILSTSHTQTLCLDKYNNQAQKQKTAHIASASVFPEKWDKNENRRRIKAHAYENRCALIFTHPKQSLLISRCDDLRAIGKRGEIVYYNVDTDPETIKNRFKNHRLELYLTLSKMMEMNE